VIDVIPVNVLEERVRHDVFGIVGTRPQTQFGLSRKKLRQVSSRNDGKSAGWMPTFCRIDTESRGMWMGYRGSSDRIAS